MAIAVSCRCGKRFKVKDHLAGKKVRCPGCRGPLRIPACSDTAAPPSDGKRPSRDTSNEAPLVTREDAEKALLRIDAAHKNKQLSAEAEAAYQDERNKLIAAYDQLAGKNFKDKKKKGEFAPGKLRKAGFFTKCADVCGALCGTLVFKYIIIVALASAGVAASIYGVQFLYTYSQSETTPPTPIEVQRDELMKKADEAVKAKKWGEAREALEELRRTVPMIEKNNKYKDLMAKLTEGADKN